MEETVYLRRADYRWGHQRGYDEHTSRLRLILEPNGDVDMADFGRTVLLTIVALRSMYACNECTIGNI
jgi:hypothetical protein